MTNIDRQINLNIYSININGVLCQKKLLKMWKHIIDHKIIVCYVFETKVKELGLEYFQIFPPRRFKTIFTNQGQGMMTIIKIGTSLAVEFADESELNTLIHITKIDNASTSLKVAGIYEPPSSTFTIQTLQKFTNYDIRVS